MPKGRNTPTTKTASVAVVLKPPPAPGPLVPRQTRATATGNTPPVNAPATATAKPQDGGDRDTPEHWADLATEQHLYTAMGQEVKFFEPYLEDIGFIAPYMALLQMLIDPPNLIINIGMHPHAIMAQVRGQLAFGVQMFELCVC